MADAAASRACCSRTTTAPVTTARTTTSRSSSGQAPQPDVQNDCPYYDRFSGHVDKAGGSLKKNSNYGQMVSAAGVNAAAGQNGCVYPKSVPTLFNQLDANKVSWKGYAQDLGNPDTPAGSPPHSVGAKYCGAPFTKPGPTGSTSFPNPGSANATDQYVPKHFPFPWFQSVLSSGNCNSKHIANVFSPTNGLYHDLQRESTTPAFSWITPNNCSDGHDAVCAGNNLSGGWANPNTPKTPVNYTGGLYAADLFLEHVIPMIERSPAFRDGGLIDITFDEGFPPFTYTGNSFANSTIVAPNATDLDRHRLGRRDAVRQDRALASRPDRTCRSPRTPRATSCIPAPGTTCSSTAPPTASPRPSPSSPPAPACWAAANHSPGPRTDATATAPAGGTTITDKTITVLDKGRAVTGTGIPAGAYVGTVTNSFVNATAPSSAGGFVITGSFSLVNASGQPLADDRRGQRHHARGRDAADRPAVRRHRTRPPAAVTPAAS